MQPSFFVYDYPTYSDSARSLERSPSGAAVERFCIGEICFNEGTSSSKRLRTGSIKQNEREI